MVFFPEIGKPGKTSGSPQVMSKRLAMENPGGFEEATVTCRFTERVYLKTRAGFIKFLGAFEQKKRWRKNRLRF